jgi:hypothetical protein
MGSPFFLRLVTSELLMAALLLFYLTLDRIIRYFECMRHYFGKFILNNYSLRMGSLVLSQTNSMSVTTTL